MRMHGGYIKTLWAWRPVRLVTGIVMIVVGLVGLVLPLLPGLLFLGPGLIIILREFMFFRMMMAKFFMKFPRCRRWFGKGRAWVRRKTGFLITFRHPDSMKKK